MYFRHLLLFVLCVLIVQVKSVHDLEGCTLDVVSAEIKKLSPLLFRNHTTYLELAIPEKGKVNLKMGDGITLACPGKRNYLTATNSNSSYATCIKEKVLRIGEESLNFDMLECKNRVKSEVLKTNVRCANKKGYISEIGFRVTENDWATFIKVCHDNTTGVTFYSEHYLYGNEVKYSAKGQDRPNFSKEGLGSNISEESYTRKSQKFTFDSLLGSEELASYYLNNKSYLARGHLSPNADFLLMNYRRATFYLINATPQWQVINAGNWKAIEGMVKMTAGTYNRNFTIITGTYGVLALRNVNNTPTPIYLVPGSKLPVPNVLWKIMYDQRSQEGIAIVVVNNPFAEEMSKKDVLCENVCDKYGWSKPNWDDVYRGFIYCCDLGKFLKAVNTAPRLKIKGALFGPICLDQFESLVD
ncbi:uncharacterized protein LOC108905688 [Anoplophora glabripennis]|uniref:uncharacterized protein LOC108905688 n=1 Tax=Anoplophora glabripennis TaxID=217634 RepID=UPI000C79131D|nr:uncharacterized protein LOC108905688 [Anoplophora glabripennis]